jgi:alkylation response protein AidB-like acyl-CoA dehydrogenase
MSLDLEFDDIQRAVADAVGHFCRDHAVEEATRSTAAPLSRSLWKGLADLGVLRLATPEGEGGALELVAAVEALGRANFPGPLAASFLATQVLPPSEREAVAAGESLVSVGVPPLMPWAPAADLFIVIDGEQAWRGRLRGAPTPVETLGGEPWGRVELEPEADLGPALQGLVLSDLVRAAYLAASAEHLVERASEHARTRKQFGRAIGDFQAVAHPLADCAIRLAAARTLARLAAFRFEADPAATRGPAGAARLSATRAALEAAHVAHQVFGAVGVTVEGPVFQVSRRLRQLASQPPGESPARASVLELFGL